MTADRRSFLRTTLGAVAGAAMGGCVGSEGGSPAERVRIDRPVVRPRSDGAVWIDAPLRARPVAYVSMASRRVFVDRGYRDRASWLLDAHISVSTGLWRIPLPGDSPLTPIPPGDESREFEERPIGDWEPGVAPIDGDVRIVLARRVGAIVSLECVPVQGTVEWIAADPIEHDGALGEPADPVREDFGAIGRGRRYGDRDCAEDGVDVPIFGWACRP